jgi:[ribosomal protein S5]-alanine N-acetyltransferase
LESPVPFCLKPGKVTTRFFKPFPELRTGRLTLRQPAFSDIHEIFQLRSDSNVNRFLDRAPARSLEDAGKFIRSIHEKTSANESVYWAITEHSTGKLIGTICLFRFSDEGNQAEIGYELLPSFQKKGVMREAVPAVLDYGFAKIGLHTIEACTHVNNLDSARLLHRFQFVRGAVVDGEFMILKLTADNWRKQR